MKNTSLSLEFPFTHGREVVCKFDGGDITSDAGSVFVSQADRNCRLTEKLAGSIKDKRDSTRVIHSVRDILRERIYSIALGYEDANDLDILKNDSALKVACGKLPSAVDVLASQPTVSRLENMVGAREMLGMGLEMAGVVVSLLPRKTRKVILDIDATDDPCHGQQELIRYDGHYGCYCYVPLYLHITDETGCQRLLGTLLRSASARSPKAVMSLVKLAVRVIRQRFPDVQIILRGDCGFGYGLLMNWCDLNGVDYVFGLQPTTVRKRMLPIQMEMGRNHRSYGDGYKHYEEFHHHGRTWSSARRVIARVEISGATLDTRCVVTNDAKSLPEDLYSFYTERGDRENRIKEMKLDLVSGRTSCHRFLANQFRLLLHSAACVLVGVLQHALWGSKWEKAQVGTLRLRLLKVGARVVQSCRKVWFHLPTSYPDKDSWVHLHNALCSLG